MIDVSPWSGLDLVEPATGGNRSEVWKGSLEADPVSVPVSVRRSLRSPESLVWELDLLELLGRNGFVVPEVIPSDSGAGSVHGIVVQRWLGGRPPTSMADWQLVADQLNRLHLLTGDHTQRPGCSVVTELRAARRSVDADLDRIPQEVVEVVLEVFENLPLLPTAVVHGDPHADNVRIGSDGTVGLLDWDESRVDVLWHDLSNLGVQVLGDGDHHQAQRLSNAWEAATSWVAEPDYALSRFRLLGDAPPD